MCCHGFLVLFVLFFFLFSLFVCLFFVRLFHKSESYGHSYEQTSHEKYLEKTFAFNASILEDIFQMKQSAYHL